MDRGFIQHRCGSRRRSGVKSSKTEGRRGEDISDYDIVMGGVANDKVFNTVELFFDGLIDKGEAIKRLRYERPNMQIVFRTQKVIDACLRFERGERL